ncbi:unnamed protein product (macronuclear) [Paramecium tetraurelia]|uniref:Uncharacterized protein n=1 Tax=Paramecium tetraurelia TaxID=5888 RepID=A0D8E2_PARTE|nr:uncharacterized protein GSPATT00039327001 [Paramecium tetraurelia]CAK79309.1 unnamed protein product [Paramecium tetraurelia]|eukprot:XP_001446706.1 hypothetical protein (macronuclear) [Paramecium tetraurelia strain d4-2]
MRSRNLNCFKSFCIQYKKIKIQVTNYQEELKIWFDKPGFQQLREKTFQLIETLITTTTKESQKKTKQIYIFFSIATIDQIERLEENILKIKFCEATTIKLIAYLVKFNTIRNREKRCNLQHLVSSITQENTTKN